MDYRLHLSVFAAVALVLGLSTDGLANDRGRLDAEAMKTALRTDRVEEDDFITYVVRLTRLGILPRDTVEAAFLWARRKAVHRFQYFREAVIHRAAEEGIRLTRRPTSTIVGQVTWASLIPANRVRVELRGTTRTAEPAWVPDASWATETSRTTRVSRATTTDRNGRFAFRDLPWGEYTIHAERYLLDADRLILIDLFNTSDLLFRYTDVARISLPTDSEPAVVNLTLGVGLTSDDEGD